MQRTSHHNQAVAERQHLKRLIRRAVAEVRFDYECCLAGIVGAPASLNRDIRRLRKLWAERKAAR